MHSTKKHVLSQIRMWKPALAVCALGVGAYLASRNFPIYVRNPPKLKGTLAAKFKNDLILQKYRTPIMWNKLHDVVWQGRLLYAQSGSEFTDDPAFLNLLCALESERKENWNMFNFDDGPVRVVKTPGYFLYNDLGLRIKKPRAQGGIAMVHGLIDDVIENSFE